jgi:pimeloyl-ACP methyl ester carboxylesterase
MLATVVAAQHPGRLSGVVLVDPLHPREFVMPTPRQMTMLRGGAFLSRWGALLASVGFVRFNLFLVSLRIPLIPKLAARLSSGGAGSGLVERMVGQVKKMPEDLHSAVRAHWSQAKPFRTMASYLENLPLSCAQAATVLASLKRPIPLPCIVISGAHVNDRGLEWHRSLAELFAQAEHRIAPQGGHWVHLDHPETVVAAIRDLAPNS